MNPLYAVPDDDASPYPLDFDRLVEHVRELGYGLDVIVEGRAAGAIFDTIPFHFSIDASGRFLSIRAMWDTGLPFAPSQHAIFAAADSWNREKYFPTVYAMPGQDRNAEVLGDLVLDITQGVSNDQLTQNIRAGVSTGLDAMAYMQEAAAQTLGWVDPRAK